MQGHRSSAFAAALVLAFAGFTGTALAGGGHGHGGGGDHGSSGQSQWSGSEQGGQSGDHGSQGGWHGSQSQPSSDQSQSTSTQSGDEGGSSRGHGSWHGSDRSQPSEGSQQSSYGGKHEASDTSKRYGNGKSAYEIAHGNAPTITSPSQLSGPGNSGLHKVTICHKTGSGYVRITVDVHALKHGHTTAKGDLIPAPASGCPAEQATSGEQQTVPLVGYCKLENGQWVYKTAPASELAKEAGDSDVIAPHFSYHGKDYSSHWDSKGQSIFERCRHGEHVSAVRTTPPPATAEDHKVTICHATGSSTNPYVEITVDKHALWHGHTTAKGDIIPAPASGCPTGQSAAATESQQCSCNTSEQQSTPQQPAAPQTPAPPQSQPAAESTPAPTTPAPATPAPATPAPATPAPPAPAPAAPATSGTAGVQATQTTPAPTQAEAAPATSPTSGVAGASHTLGSSPTRSGGVLGATLPFTGFPLWAVALAALVVIGIGLAFNRAGSRR